MADTIKCSWCKWPVATVDFVIEACAKVVWRNPTQEQIEALTNHVKAELELLDLPHIQKSP